MYKNSESTEIDIEIYDFFEKLFESDSVSEESKEKISDIFLNLDLSK